MVFEDDDLVGISKLSLKGSAIVQLELLRRQQACKHWSVSVVVTKWLDLDTDINYPEVLRVCIRSVLECLSLVMTLIGKVVCNRRKLPTIVCKYLYLTEVTSMLVISLLLIIIIKNKLYFYSVYMTSCYTGALQYYNWCIKMPINYNNRNSNNDTKKSKELSKRINISITQKI